MKVSKNELWSAWAEPLTTGLNTNRENKLYAKWTSQLSFVKNRERNADIRMMRLKTQIMRRNCMYWSGIFIVIIVIINCAYRVTKNGHISLRLITASNI